LSSPIILLLLRSSFKDTLRLLSGAAKPVAARCYASAAYAIMQCLCVRPSVRHVRGFCQTE